MAGISGQGTTFNLPNYVGELFSVTPTDTPFLSMIGGLTGGESTTSTIFQWQGYDLRDADATRQRLEGANAPTAEARTRFNVTNVVEIHQEAVETSYTKQAAVGQYASTGSGQPNAVGINGMNPVGDEHAWQVEQHLKQIARDVEKSFLVGVKNDPSSNASARRTGGIIEATVSNVASGAASPAGTATIATNGTFTITAHTLVNGDRVVVSARTGGAYALAEGQVYYVTNVATNTFTLAATSGGATLTLPAAGGAVVTKTAVLTEAMVTDLLQTIWTNGGIQEADTATLMVNGDLKRALTKIFITDKNYQETSRTVAGVRVTTITTDFGDLNVVLNRHMPNGMLQVVSAEECSPVFLNIPGKGFLFQEDLAKVGAADRSQIYGEIGLKWGNEKKHGKLLAVTRV